MHWGSAVHCANSNVKSVPGPIVAGWVCKSLPPYRKRKGNKREALKSTYVIHIHA